MKKQEVFLLIFVLVASGLFIISIIKKDPLIKPELLSVKQVSSSLQKTVDDALKNTKGTYAVVIKNMQNGKSYTLNEDKVFEPGSLYKLWVMGTVYEKLSKGEIKMDEILSQKVEVLNEKFEIKEDEAELTEGEVTMSVAQALNQMITISHNYAALLLSERVRNAQIKEFMENYGFKDSDLGTPPKTTAQDIALFFEKLYKGELVGPDASREMMDLLKKQQLNDGLPKLLPDDAVVAHKTGELGKLKHDGGIVFTNKGDYIIVVLSESSSPLGAQDRIAQVSKAVYEYFTK